MPEQIEKSPVILVLYEVTKPYCTVVGTKVFFDRSQAEQWKKELTEKAPFFGYRAECTLRDVSPKDHITTPTEILEKCQRQTIDLTCRWPVVTS